MFNINPNTVFSPLTESFRIAGLPQSRISRILEVPDRKADLSVLIATCEEIEAERTMGKLRIPCNMSHSDTTNKSPLKLLMIPLSVVLWGGFFVCLVVVVFFFGLVWVFLRG